MSTQGSIRKDASGAWFFVVDIAGPDGKRKQLKRRGFDTKRAAQVALTELQADKQRGVFVVPLRATLGQFLLDEWLPARRVTLRPSTAASYEQLIRNYILPTIGGIRLQAVDGSTLNRLYGELLTSGRTVARRNAGAGLSAKGEVLGLRWSDVDLDAGTVTIRSTRIRYGTTIATSTPKTARGNRTIAIGPATAAALRGWRRRQNTDRLLAGSAWADRDGLMLTNVDGSAPNPEAFSNLFIDLAKRAGLPAIRLHDLRHSYATAALASGVPVKVVSQRVGHADVGVTLKVYAHVLPGDDEEAARRADSLLAP